MDNKSHWEQVYQTRLPEKVGWYKPRLDTSLDWIGSLELDPGEPLIDVGGGASTLVDDLVDEGYESITVLDISENALAASRKRLGRQSELVMWLPADVTTYRLPAGRFAFWHDRAVFHFLINPTHREAYRENLLRAVSPGCHALIATFAPEAPPKCSGQPVERYDAGGLSEFFGSGMQLVRELRELHVTPGGVEQMYQYCLFRRSEQN